MSMSVVAAAAVAVSERCLMVARISCRLDGSAICSSVTDVGTAAGGGDGVIGRDGEYASSSSTEESACAILRICCFCSSICRLSSSILVRSLSEGGPAGGTPRLSLLDEPGLYASSSSAAAKEAAILSLTEVESAGEE